VFRIFLEILHKTPAAAVSVATVTVIGSTIFMMLSSKQCAATVRVHPVHLTNVAAASGGRRPLDEADQPEPTDWPIGTYSDYIHHRHLLLLSSKADTQFTIPQRVEG